MSSNSNAKKGNKNLRALFSVICISIIALGLIVYFSTNSNNKTYAVWTKRIYYSIMRL